MRIAASVVCILVVTFFCRSVQGDIYTGDPDFDTYSKAIYAPAVDNLVFEDFQHDGGEIDRIFGNYYSELSSSDIVGFRYEIRQGLGNATPGTLVASGVTDGSYAWTNNGFDFDSTLAGYRLEADITNVKLSAGLYHLALSPETNLTDQNRAFLATTSGTGSFGGPIGNGNSFLRSFSDSLFYVSVSAAINEPKDFSYGVVNAVPEPTSLGILGVFLTGWIVIGRRSK